MGGKRDAGGEYFHSERVGGSKHFGVWPLAQAAEACFGTDEWPSDQPVPPVSIEFEVQDADAVAAAVDELREKGFALLHARSRGDRRSRGCCPMRA